jgi:hypothetical protein
MFDEEENAINKSHYCFKFQQNRCLAIEPVLIVHKVGLMSWNARVQN